MFTEKTVIYSLLALELYTHTFGVLFKCTKKKPNDEKLMVFQQGFYLTFILKLKALCMTFMHWE